MSAAEAQLQDELGGLFARGRRGLSVGSIALISMIAFEAMAVVTAMPAVALALDGLPLFALAFGGTLATSVIGMVAAGLHADRHGPLAAMSVGLLLFAGGLLVAGLAPDMNWLILGRLLQGFGMGALAVTIYVAVGRLYPDALRPKIFAMFAAAWVVPAMAGPAVAGLIVDSIGWPWVFLSIAFLMPPAALLVLPSAHRLGAPEIGRPSNRRASLTRIGYSLIAAFTALLLYRAGSDPDALPKWIVALALFGMIWAAWRLLPAGTLIAGPGLPTVVALRGLLAAGFFSAEAFIPLWLQTERGWTVTHSGLALSIGALAWSAASALQARAERPQARQRLLRSGLIAVALGTAAIAGLVISPLPSSLILLAWIITGFGIGLSFPMLSVRLMQLSGDHEKGANASALQISDALGTTAMLAVCGALFASLHESQPVAAFLAVFAICLLPALIAVLVAPRVWAE
ncbi:MFS transporter [Pseudomarimonas arenosa]|uniref:MFS transporter n=1 Tax=Pseudomarimonas arenosa TaxID=2774145 RepID=A0AAW3ZJ13_9GAMM|nr:MFS transporter [Pseudomarimonas arenosa]MBD8525773.1 MFS transporter [Pseudomarimonas arenosa]